MNEDETTGCWLAYYSDWSGFTVHAREIDALRHAVGHNMEVKYLKWGDDPRDRP